MSEIREKIERKEVFGRTGTRQEIFSQLPKINDAYPGDASYVCEEITATPISNGFFRCEVKYRRPPIGYENRTPETFGTIWA